MERKTLVVEKYYDLLRRLVVDIEKPDFTTSKWIASNKVSNEFFTATVNERYIEAYAKIGNLVKYRSLVNSDSISNDDAIRVYNEAYRISLERINKKKAAKLSNKDAGVTQMVRTIEPIKQEPIEEIIRKVVRAELEAFRGPVDIRPISEIPTLNLVTELRRRGFEGSILKMEQFNLQEL